jgi:predicted ATPase
MTVLALVGRERELGVLDDLVDGVSERNRRVDLAFATTGHRAQGLTRWRVRVMRGEPGIGKSALLAGASHTRQGTGNDGTDHHERAD